MRNRRNTRAATRTWTLIVTTSKPINHFSIKNYQTQ